MKKITLLFSAVIGLVSNAGAQQDLQFSQTINNPYFFNPAAGGMSNVGEVYFSNRSQWTGIEGHPQSFYGSISSIIDAKKKNSEPVLQEFNSERKSFYSTPQRTVGKKHVLGAKMYTDQIGPFKKSSFQGTYAYHLPINASWNMGVGLGIGWSNFGIDENKAVLTSAGDAAYLSYAANSPRQNYLDANAGLVFYSANTLISLSTTQLMNTNATFDGISSQSYYTRHYFALLSHRVPLGTKSDYTTYSAEPFVMLKYATNSPLSWDAGMRIHYQSIGYFSVMYRSQSALSLGIGCNLLKNFRLSYSYDLSIAKTRSFGAGAHEIQLGILFGHKRNLDKEFKKDERERKAQEQHQNEDN